jgi:DNA-binding FadR family transcriptional regulator
MAKASPELLRAIGKGSAPAPAPAPAPADGAKGDLSAAMQELIDAIQAGDADGAAEAFEAAHRICSSYE